MNCRTCNYVLWNLKARQCPECGTPFRPSEFEFVPNSVRFCCPHCDQPYYGTTYKGHLSPAEFDCVNCGAHIHMDAMVLRPTEGVSDEQTQAERLPWTERRRRSTIGAWFSMIGYGMTRPGRMMKALPVDASAGDAWWYALTVFIINMFFGMGLPLIAFAVITFTSGSDPYEPVMGMGLFLLGYLLSYFLLIALWGLVAHGMLKITGGCEYGIGRTYQALLYTSGVTILLAVPCLGPYLLQYAGFTWWIVASCLSVGVAQQVHGGRATLAVLTFPALVIVLGVASVFALMFWGMSQAQIQMGGYQQSPQTQVSSITSMLVIHAGRTQGAGPDHVMELVHDGLLDAGEFIAIDTATLYTEMKVGAVAIEDYDSMGGIEQREAIDAAIEALGEDVIAHRQGDYVFTYHGIDFDTMDPGLWVVISSPDPDSPGSRAPLEYWVGRVDNAVELIPAGNFVGRLQAQNDLRAQEGLPPLPSPERVRYDGLDDGSAPAYDYGVTPVP
jgi:hypothetical protein